MKKILYFLILLSFFACKEEIGNYQSINQLPKIFPDYVGVTIPINIAPLNFMIEKPLEKIDCKISYKDQIINVQSSGNVIKFNENDWKNLISKTNNDSIKVEICTKENGIWQKYQDFFVFVVKDSLDKYLTYRLIDPDFEFFSKLRIKQRNIENFDEQNICNYEMVGNKCMNCHIFANNDSKTSMFYLRGEGQGAIFNQNGKLRKLDIKTKNMVSSSTYAQFSSDERFLVFSCNVVCPSFQANANKRFEVFDTSSDIYVADLIENKIYTCKDLCDSVRLETFPCFDKENNIYFCVADSFSYNIESIKYSVCKINFDASSKTFGKLDTIILANDNSFCHPRISPNGKYMAIVESKYGTFPILHQESQQRIFDFSTGKMDSLYIVNSNKSETYHSISSNSKWIVMASKRDDGLYGKAYFYYIDQNLKAHKPFCLPQKDPNIYLNILQSFNTPELSQNPVWFKSQNVGNMLNKEAEKFEACY